jgi:PAS domain S-box-containing protein
LVGYGKEALYGREAVELFSDGPRGKARARELFEAFKNDLPIDGEELEFRHADGSIRWGSLSVSVIRDSTGRPVEGRVTVEDVTERKRIELDLHERVKELQCFYGLSKLVEAHGASLEKIFRGLLELIRESWQYPEITCAAVKTPIGRFSTDNYAQTQWKQTGRIYVHGELYGTVVVGYLRAAPEDDEGPFLPAERLLLDSLCERLGRIIERVEAEEAQRQIDEQRRLMDELNHRVKNNLNLVSSLISLKDSALGDEVDLSDIRNQVKAVSFIHQKLYETGLVKEIDFGPYITDILESVFSFYSGPAVEVTVEVGELELPAKTAVSLGLIINELATNAMKHGFTAATPPRFTVRLQNEYGRECRELSVSNSGNPLPDDVEFENPETLGLRLISALVSQLGGTVEVARKPQPDFRLRFCA